MFQQEPDKRVDFNRLNLFAQALQGEAMDARQHAAMAPFDNRHGFGLRGIGITTFIRGRKPDTFRSKPTSEDDPFPFQIFQAGEDLTVGQAE